MDAATQEQIAAGLQAGSPQAWNQFYDAYARRLWLSVAMLTGAQSAEVADILQEVFLAAARSARRYDPKRGTLWMWLWGIARKEVALHYRKAGARAELLLVQQRRMMSSSRDLLTEIVDGPPEQLACRELGTLVRAALAELPDEHQALLTGKYVEEQSAEQLATDTALSVSAVYSKLARARQAFRDAFEKLTRRSRRMDDCHERARI